MALINKDTCYVLLQNPAEANKNDVQKIGFWLNFKQIFIKLIGMDDFKKEKQLTRFIVLMCTILQLDQETQTDFFVKISKHIGKQSNYAAKNILIDSLLEIDKKLSDQMFNEDKKRAIVEKLVEDIGECTPGFHNRVNEVVLSFQVTNTINDFLQNIRAEIVGGIARRHTNDVHTYNRFFYKASDQYAVHAINGNDVYVGQIYDGVIINTLAEEFPRRYQFWFIFNSLREQIQTHLTHSIGYNGNKEEGYLAGDYEKIITFVSHFIDEENVTYDECFVMNDDNLIVDVNWPSIMFKLWQMLNEKRYVLCDPLEKQLFDALLNPDMPVSVLKFLLKNEAAYINPRRLFDNFEQLFYFLSDSSWLPKEKKDVFFSYYISKMPQIMTAQNVLRIAPLLYKNKSSDPASFYSNKLWAGFLKKQNDRGLNALEMALATNHNAALSIIQVVQLLPLHDQLEIYKGKRPSQLSISKPSLSLLRSLKEAEMNFLLQELLEKTHHYRESAKYNPKRYQALHNETLVLYLSLTECFSAFLNSKKTEKDLDLLQVNFTQSINKAKTVYKAEHPQFMDILKEILICLTGFGALYLLYKACTHQPSSLFFYSKTEQNIENINTVLCSLSPSLSV